MEFREINSNPVYMLGDIHGNWNSVFKKLFGQDYNIIQVGDYGIFTQEDIDLHYSWNKYFNENNIHLYIIRGNHDNPLFFEDNFDIFSNIHLVKDNTILVTPEDKKILCIGGAISIDRKDRTLNYDYFTKEIIKVDPEVLEYLESNKIDSIVTHSSPLELPPFGTASIVTHYSRNDKKLLEDIYLDKKSLQGIFDKIYNNFIYEPEDKVYWYYGHYHRSEIFEIGNIESCILGIDELKLAIWSR